MADTGDDASRLDAELSLLEAMYPSELSFDSKTREVMFSPDTQSGSRAKLQLRLAADYPTESLPEVILASSGAGDVRQDMKDFITSLPIGEEALDAIFVAFQELVSRAIVESRSDLDDGHGGAQREIAQDGRNATMIIWLHHLLSTAKRKAILNPSSSAVSGISKPGYPGVLVFSGPRVPVNEHVSSLRDMNWQAFQIRAELDSHWDFKHGQGVREFETMAEMVEALGRGQDRKRIFLEAMKMKS